MEWVAENLTLESAAFFRFVTVVLLVVIALELEKIEKHACGIERLAEKELGGGPGSEHVPRDARRVTVVAGFEGECQPRCGGCAEADCGARGGEGE